MPNATVRADARTLPEATPHPDANIRALAAQFETVLKAYEAFYHGGGTDDEAAAATDAVKAVARKIIAVSGTDISIMRLKARVYLWAESTDLEKLAAEGGDWPSEAVLASLFRDLGVADSDLPAQHEEARSTAPSASDTWFDVYGDLESDIYDLMRMLRAADHLYHGSDDEDLRTSTVLLYDLAAEMAQELDRKYHRGFDRVREPTLAKPDPVLAIVAKLRATWHRLGKVIEETNLCEGPLFDEVQGVLDAAKAELLETPPTTLAGARAAIAWLVEYDEPNIPETSGEYMRTLIRSPIFAQEEALS
jgi:hypothetical protein